MKRFIVLVLCILLAAFPVSAKTVSMEYDATDLNEPVSDSVVPTAGSITELKIAAKSAVLMEVKTGEILYDCNMDEKTAPASITKIMSLLLIMEAIDSGRLAYDTVITASEHACSMGGSQIWLEPNEQMTVDELLKAAVVASANDATVALGEAVAGSEEGFVALMNKKAEELGLINTHFENCTGLDADGHLTSAHDVAVMSCELLKHEDIKKYTTIWMDSLRDGKSELVNTNKLVRFYEGCTGLKTGTTSLAGCCLAASAERDGMELVAVIMDADNSKERFEGAKKLLNYGFANFTFKTIEAQLGENKNVKVLKGVQSFVEAQPENVLNLLMPKASTGDITQTVEINGNITAPVKAGDNVGTVHVFSGDNEVGTISLTAANDVGKMNILYAMYTLLVELIRI